MDTEKLGNSRFLNILFKPAGLSMESPLRRRLMPPEKTLRRAGLRPGQAVLEVGCGSGFFTLPAAEMIGEDGRLVAMDPLSDFVDKVKRKVRDAGFANVEVIKRDALNTKLETASMDLVLLFGVLPFPALPLDKLLPEMHRVLKSGGSSAVWMFPISFGVPRAIHRSGLFALRDEGNSVYTFNRSDDPA